jgi:hypothetical protein
VQVGGTVQFQFVPDIETSVSPAGTVSVTVTVPLVGAAPAAFDTVTVYCAFCCPWLKLPMCVLRMDNVVGVKIVVGSFPVFVDRRPSATLTWFVSGVGAVPDTFTVTVIVG